MMMFGGSRGGSCVCGGGVDDDCMWQRFFPASISKIDFEILILLHFPCSLMFVHVIKNQKHGNFIMDCGTTNRRFFFSVQSDRSTYHMLFAFEL